MDNTKSDCSTQDLVPSACHYEQQMRDLQVKYHPDCPNEDAILPPAKHGDVGFDLKLWIEEPGGILNILPQRMVNIRTGVHIKLPTGYWGDIRSRSSTFAKRKLFVMNGTIDEGYTGEISIFIWNPTLDAHELRNGDRLAQLVIIPRIVPQLNVVEELPITDRGTSGFGSTDEEKK